MAQPFVKPYVKTNKNDMADSEAIYPLWACDDVTLLLALSTKALPTRYAN